MSLDPLTGPRSVSPASSGRSSPVPRASRRIVEDASVRPDKQTKRYALGIERALASWETNPQEWADYIAFLGRLLKALQNHPKDISILPCSPGVASRLAQCLNPSLPSGVHQKALEVYAHIFELLGTARLTTHLHEFLPGLSTVLSFASLSVRPGFYHLLEDYVTELQAEDLRPALKSLVLSILPALEDETSEDFERAYRLLEKLRSIFGRDISNAEAAELKGRFWQCVFLATITSVTRRQGALNYLVRTLPNFKRQHEHGGTNGVDLQSYADALAPEARHVLEPEPGLLIRCFACGLSDPQTLIQRGFLDLLGNNLPLDSPALQGIVQTDDLDRLVAAALQILLRRDMGLNRRLWAWFLGPEPAQDVEGDQSQANKHQAHFGRLEYFSNYGKSPLKRSILAMFARDKSMPADVARPFRISLSLMDRWEIGGSVIPDILLPALQCAHSYCQRSSENDSVEVLRSASLFFDGVEAHLIWAKLFEALHSPLSKGQEAVQELDNALGFLSWVIAKFNISDNEMLDVHVPNFALYLTCNLANFEKDLYSSLVVARIITTIRSLINLIPSRALETKRAEHDAVPEEYATANDTLTRLSGFYLTDGQANKVEALEAVQKARLLAELITDAALQSLTNSTQRLFSEIASLLLVYSSKVDAQVLPGSRLLDGMTTAVKSAWPPHKLMPFETLAGTVRLVSNVTSRKGANKDKMFELAPILTVQVWERLSPTRPKHHVEAVRLFWQLDQLSADNGGTAASLASLVRTAQVDAAVVDGITTDRVRCFMTLWEHTIVPDESAANSGKTRRGSAMPKLEAKDEHRHMEVLSGPLFLMLDLLEAENKRAADIVAAWLGRLPSLGRVLGMLIYNISTIVARGNRHRGWDDRREERRIKTEQRELQCSLKHIYAILERANGFVWHRLQETNLASSEIEAGSALMMLGTACVELIKRTNSATDDQRDLNRTAISILRLLLEGPMASHMKALEAEIVLMDTTMDVLDGPNASLQGSLLKALSLALKVRLSGIAFRAPPTPREPPRSSIGTRSPAPHNGEPPSPSVPAFVPPPKLLQCIQAGFTATSARFHLDHWLLFLRDVLPIFADAIFSTLLPLVSCFCNALERCFKEITDVSRADAIDTATAPETTIISLIEALDMVLARAHECMLEEVALERPPRPDLNKRTQPPMAQNMFKAEAPPSKTAKANTRLTVILAFQDAVRICLTMWSWASRHAEHSDEDHTSSATTVHNALKLRNRAKRLLDQIFAVELLESMEVLIDAWCTTTEPNEAATSLSLLHVMNCTGPRSSVPAIFDALCSRTNASELDADRRSSLTCDASAADIAIFLATYLETLENDALDEIWSDCLAFLRTASKDALPFRSVLPTLLWTVLLLAEKLEKTNFGEQRKMRREIADTFQRLMSATLATLPPSSLSDGTFNDSKQSSLLKSDSAGVKQRLQLAPVLCHLIANLETVTESQDKTNALVNSITTSLITPLFHSKAFPSNVNTQVLEVLLQLSKKAPAAKPWKKDVLEAFNDPRFLHTPLSIINSSWFPVLRQWCLNDRERMPEILSRLTPPSSAGIMFGVGASAARLEADRKSQAAIRRACILLLSTPEDVHAAHMPIFEEKIGELLSATASSSPSSAIKAELFMACRALIMSVSAVHLAPLWPIINDTLQSALSSLLPRSSAKDNAYTNLSLLQACKLLDLLIGLSPEEFQLHEWLYITDTIDAVYQPTQWQPMALADHVSEELGIADLDESTTVLPQPTLTSDSTASKAPLSSNMLVDARDAKVMAREDFARMVLRPFLSQLSLHAYESVYNMEALDLTASRDDLLKDVLDMSTMVE